MKKFIVSVPEVHYQQVEVEAIDEDDARQRVCDGEGEYLDGALEYSHTLDGDVDLWEVEESPNDD